MCPTCIENRYLGFGRLSTVPQITRTVRRSSDVRPEKLQVRTPITGSAYPTRLAVPYIRNKAFYKRVYILQNARFRRSKGDVRIVFKI